jgi:hypothetical protein
MVPDIDTKDPASVCKEVQAAYRTMHPEAEADFVPSAIGWVTACFTGRHGDYQAIDASYHDLEHTLQVTLCLARLLLGRHRAGALPVLSRRTSELALLAVLLHDSGYLKKRHDTVGTGAKYTVNHVQRSLHFAEDLLREKKFSIPDIQAVQRMILCTVMNADVRSIRFPNEEEKIAGCAVGTADLLGQMAADDYLEKLPRLYLEFAEAARPEPNNAVSGEELRKGTGDLLRKTPAFWERYVLPKVRDDYGALYRYFSQPFPDGPNFYLDRIEANLRRLQDVLKKQA